MCAHERENKELVGPARKAREAFRSIIVNRNPLGDDAREISVRLNASIGYIFGNCVYCGAILRFYGAG